MILIDFISYADPCPGVCGYGAVCRVHAHSPICSCPADFTGDPFRGCTRIPPPPPEPKQPVQRVDPCLNNGPCGQYAYCRAVGDVAQCHCYENYIGKYIDELSLSKMSLVYDKVYIFT